MRILQVNTVYKVGSTGKIVAGIEEQCDIFGIEHFVAYRYKENKIQKTENEIEISTWLDCHIHNRLSSLTGFQGYFSYFRTKKFIRAIKRINPDIIHLHNIHGSYINLRLLTNYLKKRNKPVIWTLHDCWGFTGLCPYFTENKCNRWMDNCGNCIVCSSMGMKVDFTEYLLKKKKELFSNIPQMTIITPSNWLKYLVVQSYLSQYPIEVINNGIDLSVFYPRKRDLKSEWGVKDKYVILGVAYDWGHRKGLDIFIELSHRLSNDYVFVLVGTNDEVDLELPDNVISIHKTNNQSELAEIYSAADLFFNPTREDNYPTVNMEALACGTPVVTFDTGGSAEMIDECCGVVVKEDMSMICNTFERIRNDCPFNKNSILNYSMKFDQKSKFLEYINIYRKVKSEV